MIKAITIVSYTLIFKLLPGDGYDSPVFTTFQQSSILWSCALGVRYAAYWLTTFNHCYLFFFREKSSIQTGGQPQTACVLRSTVSNNSHFTEPTAKT